MKSLYLSSFFFQRLLLKIVDLIFYQCGDIMFLYCMQILVSSYYLDINIKYVLRFFRFGLGRIGFFLIDDIYIYMFFQINFKRNF